MNKLFWFPVVLGILFAIWKLSYFSDEIDSQPREVVARGDLAQDEKTTIEIFEKTRGCVVFISTKQQVMDFWSRNVFSVPRGTGSGFIWDDKGHVVTNNHVIAGASSAEVKLADGRSYKATLIGASPGHDIAVLRIGIGLKQPQAVPLGSSHDLKVGQKVFAIGNPFGLDWTLTSGIISALDRSLSNDEANIEHLIQTDAAINPGNSGGPLLDSAGRLIGINTAIFSPSGAYAGVGFAIPVDTVNRVVPQLINNGKYVRPTIGIGVDERLNTRLSEELGIQGVFVLSVQENSSADKAGIKAAKYSPYEGIVPGDIIISINDKPITSVAKLMAVLDDLQIGAQVKVTFQRSGEKREVFLELEPGI